tara:strand:- start:78 stop:347 length:270 start_codon:yes stop_codon:yes gene_type:complete
MNKIKVIEYIKKGVLLVSTLYALPITIPFALFIYIFGIESIRPIGDTLDSMSINFPEWMVFPIAIAICASFWTISYTITSKFLNRFFND